MNLVCQREPLLAAFQTVASVVPQRSPKPILQNVKLEVTGQSAFLLATDLEIGIRCEVPGIEIRVPGSAILPVGRFGSILRESTDDVLHLEATPEKVTVRGERSVFHLPSVDPAEYPAVAGFQETKYQEVAGRLFRELVRRTVFATDTESTRFALGGVLWELSADKFTAVATDGRRLSKMEGPSHSVGGPPPSDLNTIVPSRALQLMDRALGDFDGEVQIACRTNDVLVRTPLVTIYSRLVEGRFPRWRDVFPDRKNAQQIELTVGPTLSALRQAAIVASEESRGVDFTFAEGTMTLNGQSSEKGDAKVEMPVGYTGKPLEITLDHRFVADFLKTLDPQRTFTLEMTDSDSAALCSTDDGYAYVIMPLARDRR